MLYVIFGLIEKEVVWNIKHNCLINLAIHIVLIVAFRNRYSMFVLDMILI